MSATITLRCGSGIAAITYAWVNSSGTRTPSSGYATLTGSTTLTNCDHVWIEWCSVKTDYSTPYYVKFGTTTLKTSYSSSIQYNYYPSSRGTVSVEATYSVTYVTANLKCGTGIASYQVFNSSGGVVRTISSKSYVSFSLIEGDYYELGNIKYEDGYSGVKWYYNSSASYSYENRSTTSPDYVLGSSYDRYGYFEATTYIPPVTYYTCSATYYSGCSNMFSSITVGGESSVQVAAGNTATWRCTVKSGYTFLGWYNEAGNRVSTSTTYTVNDIQYGRTYYARAQVSSYTYYYRVNLYIDGSLYDYATDSTTSSASTGTNISLATAQSYFSIGSGYSFSSASAGANCTYSNGYFTITSTSSSSRSVCNLYYVTNTYDYLYRVRLYLDGSLDDYVNGSVNTTGSSGYLTLAQAQAMFSIAARYQFSSASAGNSYASYSSTYQRFTLTSTSSRGYCDLYYITKTYTVGATYGTGCSGMYSSITVNNAGSATVSYGSTATWRCTPATGYSFVGWYSDAACTSLVSSNAEYSETIYSSKTLYAKLQANTYTATASRSGFTCCFSSVTVSKSNPAYGESVTFTANLNTGYTFRGWYNASGTRVSTSRSYTATVTGNITLYARADVQWTYEKSEGSYRISAEEWTRLQTYITQRNGASFTYTATVGASLSANLYNDTRNGIGTGATVSKGQAITAALLNALITNANNL